MPSSSRTPTGWGSPRPQSCWRGWWPPTASRGWFSPGTRRCPTRQDRDACSPTSSPAALCRSSPLPRHPTRIARATQLDALVRSLRAGELPAVDPTRRDVVVTPAGDPQQAVRRAVQLVTSSVPRVFGVSATDTLVLAPRAGGVAGARGVARRAGRRGCERRTHRDDRRGSSRGSGGGGPGAGRGVGGVDHPRHAGRGRDTGRSPPVRGAPGRSCTRPGGGAPAAPAATHPARRTARRRAGLIVPVCT